MGVLKSEFSATASHLKSFGSSTEQLKNKQDYLTKAMDLQKQKVDALRKSYEDTKAKTGENSKETENAAKKVNNAAKYYNDLEGQLKQVNSELDKQKDKWLKVSQNCESAGKKIQDAGKKMSDIGGKLTTRVTLPIVGAGAAAVSLASDFNENLNKVDVAFGDSGDIIKEWSKTTLDSFGIARGTALELASGFGDMATSMGLTNSEAASMSKELVGRAGDLSSFKNISIDVANTAMTSIFTGETESLKKLGVVMTQTNLDAYAMSHGFGKTTKDMTETEKVQLRYQYVMEKTGNAMGDFANTSDGTANSTRVFKESLKELGENFGQNILPVITPFIQKLTEMTKKFTNLSPETQKFILAFLGILATVGPVLIGVGKVVTSVGGMVSVFGKVSGAISKAGGLMAVLTSPTGIAIMAIMGVIAVVVLLVKNWDKVTETAAAFGRGISAAWDDAKNKTVQAFEDMKNGVKEKINAIKNFFSNIHLPEIKIPKIKLPHFKLEGEFSLKPPSTPHLGVDWYYNGGIFKSPTILGGIGVGDQYNGHGSNSEAVVPLDEMYSNLNNIVNQNKQPIYVVVNVDNNMDSRPLAKSLTTQIKKEITRDNKNYMVSKGAY